jgi:uncharacterized repeat protein (TIGR03803 family)
VLKNFTGGDGWSPWGDLVLTGSTLYGTRCSGGSTGNGAVFKVNTDGSGYAVLKSFFGTDGDQLYAGLVLGGTTLYGTTGYGDTGNCGVVFKVNTDGSGFAVLKSFTGSDGDYPAAGLVLAGSTLYGTTYGGGSWAHGVVFSLAGIAVTPPAITKPPLTRTAEAGTAPWFSVGVTNTPPESTSYQWYFTGTNALGNATSLDFHGPPLT